MGGIPIEFRAFGLAIMAGPGGWGRPAALRQLPGMPDDSPQACRALARILRGSHGLRRRSDISGPPGGAKGSRPKGTNCLKIHMYHMVGLVFRRAFTGLDLGRHQACGVADGHPGAATGERGPGLSDRLKRHRADRRQGALHHDKPLNLLLIISTWSDLARRCRARRRKWNAGSGTCRRVAV